MVKNTLKKLIKRNTPRWVVLMIDMYLVINSFILAYFIRFNFTLNFDMELVLRQLPVIGIGGMIGFILIGSYKGVIRHTGLRDAFNVTLASIISLILLTFVVYLNRQLMELNILSIPLSILVIHFLLNVTILIASRFLFKELYVLITVQNENSKKVLIYGAGGAGLLTYSVLKDDKEINVNVVGFIDDDKRKEKKRINGLNVFSLEKMTQAFITSKEIDEIIISIQNIKTSRLLEIVDKLANLSAEVKIVPTAKSWINGDLNAKQIKSVKIEDLLGREPILLNNQLLKKEFNQKIILITGAAGSIGSEITRQLSTYKCQHLILVDQAESDLYNLQQYFVNKNIDRITAIVADVRNVKRMESIFEEYQPQIIFHAAAYKHVPFMEENPYEAVRVNVEGTKIVSDLAVAYHVEKFVMVSTDKAVNPTNVMGATKRIAEMCINTQNLRKKTKFITTRFGNVLGSNGSVIPLFQSQIEGGGPLTLTHKDITRYFMTIPEACQLVLEAGSMGDGGEIFVFDMGKSIKIYDLARNMIHLSGLRFPEDIDIKVTGLRPGEKIYEELLADGENTSETHHEKIMIASVKKIDEALVVKQIQALIEINHTISFEKTVAQMKVIVPEFISNNSTYMELDQKKEQTLVQNKG